jgi:hypothetical protein
MKKEYCLENLKKDYYYYSYSPNEYFYSLDVAEDPQKVKAEKIAKERERRINSILS